MIETASSILMHWSNFYIMTGSAAGGLTGLMFVVITLVKRTESKSAHDGISTFSTPTVVHFCAALFASAVLSAPWHWLIGPAVLLGLTGAGGVVYLVRVMHRTKHLTAYRADLEDWTWYSMLPFVAYGAMFVGAMLLHAFPEQALYVVAASVALLIFIGIRNAWDIVTYIAIGQGNEPPESS